MSGHWHSFANSPKRMEFRLVCTNAQQCNELANRMVRHPEEFGRHFSLSFFHNSSPRQAVSGALTGRFVLNSPLISELNSRNPEFPSIAITPSDRQNIVAQLVELLDNSLDQESIIHPNDYARLDKALTAAGIFGWSLGAQHETVAVKLNKVYAAATPAERKQIEGIVLGMGEGDEGAVRDLLANVLQTSPELVPSRIAKSAKWDGSRFSPIELQVPTVELDRLRQNLDKIIVNVTVRHVVPTLTLPIMVRADMKPANFHSNPSPVKPETKGDL